MQIFVQNMKKIGGDIPFYFIQSIHVQVKLKTLGLKYFGFLRTLRTLGPYLWNLKIRTLDEVCKIFHSSLCYIVCKASYLNEYSLKCVEEVVEYAGMISTSPLTVWTQLIVNQQQRHSAVNISSFDQTFTTISPS